MVMSGIQFISSVAALQANSPTVTAVSSAQEARNGLQELGADVVQATLI